MHNPLSDLWLTNNWLRQLQVPSSSKSGTASVQQRVGDSVGNPRTALVTTPARPLLHNVPRARESLEPGEGATNLLAMREGETLPAGYIIVVRDPAATPQAAHKIASVDLCTPPTGGAHAAGEDSETAKRNAASKRNVTRSTNKQALAAFAKGLKSSLAGGHPPTIEFGDDQTHLKARWHAAAKEIAYKLLDLRKNSWKEYSQFEKSRVHNELNAHYNFDPPLSPHRIDKFLANHLRSSRSVWKAHWTKGGDENRHPNCPEEAWAKLIKWWCTEACMEESAEMAARRSLVQKSSKTGRTRLVDRMEEHVTEDEEVRVDDHVLEDEPVRVDDHVTEDDQVRGDEHVTVDDQVRVDEQVTEYEQVRNRKP